MIYNDFGLVKVEIVDAPNKPCYMWIEEEKVALHPNWKIYTEPVEETVAEKITEEPEAPVIETPIESDSSEVTEVSDEVVSEEKPKRGRKKAE